jgi:GNAT superfamily N-acetyltransferase
MAMIVEVEDAFASPVEEISRAVTVLPVSYSAILDAPNAVALLRIYAEHCLVADPEPQRSLYEAMEKSGAFQAFAAYFNTGSEEILIGFVGVIRTIVMHDGHLIGAIESLFVDPAYRSTGAFFLLIAAAEHFATDSGCRCLLASARIGSALDTILSRRGGYEKTHSQHTRWLNGYKGGRL